MIKGVSPEFERILEAGNSAPSGENCQPWHFVVSGNTIEVHLLPERDQSAYSWGQRSSYLANGAVIENMVIAASAEGYRADVQYFPNQKDIYHVATITFAKDTSIKSDPLSAFVGKRVSNRKPYKKAALTDKEKDVLLSVAADGIKIIEAPEDVKRLGRISATNEEVMLANQSLHSFFFSHVSWTKREDEEKKVGFYIETLELPLPAKVMFKLFKNWGTMNVFNKIGFNRVVAKQNATVNSAVSAVGAFSVNGLEPMDFVKAGRMIERFWITATSLGLNVQPIAGLLFFKLKIDAGETDPFTLEQQKLVTDVCNQAADIVKAGNKRLIFMCRLGRGDAPSACAIRFPLNEVVSVK